MPHSYPLGSLQTLPTGSPAPTYDFLCPSTWGVVQSRGLTSRGAPLHQREAGVGRLNTPTSSCLGGKLWGVSYSLLGGPQWIGLELPTAITCWLHTPLWLASFPHCTAPLPIVPPGIHLPHEQLIPKPLPEHLFWTEPKLRQLVSILPNMVSQTTVAPDLSFGKYYPKAYTQISNFPFSFFKV